jgi:hypothetical protein
LSHQAAIVFSMPQSHSKLKEQQAIGHINGGTAPPPPFMGLPCTRVFHKMGLHTGKVTTFSTVWMTFKPQRYNSYRQIHCTHKRIQSLLHNCPHIVRHWKLQMKHLFSTLLKQSQCTPHCCKVQCHRVHLHGIELELIDKQLLADEDWTNKEYDLCLGVLSDISSS